MSSLDQIKTSITHYKDGNITVDEFVKRMEFLTENSTIYTVILDYTYPVKYNYISQTPQTNLKFGMTDEWLALYPDNHPYTYDQDKATKNELDNRASFLSYLGSQGMDLIEYTHVPYIMLRYRLSKPQFQYKFVEMGNHHSAIEGNIVSILKPRNTHYILTKTNITTKNI
jgi:hypothetical protein